MTTIGHHLAQAALAATVACLAFGAAAQQGGGPPRGPWVFNVAGGAVHQFDAGLDGGGGFSSSRYFIQGGVGYGFSRRTSVSLSIGYGETDYDFSGGATLGGAAPWDRIRDLRLSLPIRFGVSEGLDAIVIPSVRWNAETGADLDDGRREGVLAGALYRVTPSFAIGPGIGAFSRISSGAELFPILLLDWDITDTLNLGTGRGLAATQGPGLVLTWKTSDTLSLGIGARVENQEFRLDDSGPAPGGVGQEESFPLFVSATWRPHPLGSISAVAGADFNGRLRISGRGGRTIDKQSYDTAPFIGVTGSLRF